MIRLGASASLIEYNSMKFVITYMPDNICTRHYIKDLQQYNTGKLVKTCKSSYNPQIFSVVDITLEDLEYPDGTFPTGDIIDKWLKIVKQFFHKYRNTAIAVHCCTGLGRSAVLIAIALMESGIKPQNAIEMIRLKRRGAFNEHQLEEIGKYKSRNRLVEKNKYFHRFSSRKKTPRVCNYNQLPAHSNQSI